MKRKLTKREKFRNVCEEVNDNFLDYDEPLDEAYSEIINLEIGEVYLLHHEDDDVFLAFEREAYCLWIWNVDWAEFWQNVNGNGPLNKERLHTRAQAYEDGAWVREGVLAYARKKELKKDQKK